MLFELIACNSAGSGLAGCRQPPEGMRPQPGAGPVCADRADGGDKTERPPVNGPRVTREGSWTPDCTAADRPGGPTDYGDPTDPNGPEPPDPGQIPHLVHDGVTDPVNPGEEETAPRIRLDMFGTLGGPANPPGADDSDRIPGGGPPSTGDAERRP